MLVKCEDTYLAAWLLMNGADFLSLEKRNVKADKSTKYGFHQKWIIHMLCENDEALKAWREGTAEGKVKDYAYARIKLKRKIKKYENRNSR